MVPGKVAHFCNISSWKTETGEFFGFQASLGYTVSFKAAWAESKNDLRKPE